MNFIAELHSENAKIRSIITASVGMILNCEPASADFAESFILAFIISPNKKVGRISPPDYFLSDYDFLFFFLWKRYEITNGMIASRIIIATKIHICLKTEVSIMSTPPATQIFPESLWV